MNGWIEVLIQLVQAMVQWLLTPYFYIAVLLVAWRNGRLAQEERRMLHVSLHAPLQQTVRQLLEGLAAGFIVSVLLLALGAVLHPSAFPLLWGLTLLLFLLRRRWQPLSLAVGLLWLASLAFQLPLLRDTDVWWREALQGLHWPAWLVLVGLLQWCEAVLLWRVSRRQAYPMVLAGRRGLPVGGYRFEGWWPLPLFVWGIGDGAGWTSVVPWWPLFADGGGWTVVPLPLYAGFAFMSRTASPEEQAAWWQKCRWLGGAVALALACVGQWWPAFSAFGVLLLLLWELAARAAWHWRERNGELYFVPDKRGLKVLAVVPGSPAEEMGVAPGEVVVKVNGRTVSSESELYHAVQTNPAFCKLEVLDRRGEVRFVQRAVYEGTHHQLGIIAVPVKRETELYTGDGTWTKNDEPHVQASGGGPNISGERQASGETQQDGAENKRQMT